LHNLVVAHGDTLKLLHHLVVTHGYLLKLLYISVACLNECLECFFQ